MCPILKDGKEHFPDNYKMAKLGKNFVQFSRKEQHTYFAVYDF